MRYGGAIDEVWQLPRFDWIHVYIDTLLTIMKSDFTELLFEMILYPEDTETAYFLWFAVSGLL